MHKEFEADQTGAVLVLDDEKNIVAVLKAILEKRGFQVFGFTDARTALDALRTKHFDAVITDLYMPDIDGMAFLAEVSRLYSGLPVIMITAFGTVDSAVDAIKKGAFDYITKPFEQTEIATVVQKAVNSRRLKQLELEAPNEMDSSEYTILHGNGAAMQDVQRLLAKVAASPSLIFIMGEAGTGKELLAEEIHKKSTRAYQSLIKLNCSAAASIFLEQELFGSSNKVGKIEVSHKGTLFVDEISEMSLETQSRFLTFLEEEKPNYDVRLIVASRKDLQQEVKEGRFREDLFYKINACPIKLPSLRERKDDLKNLTDYFIRRLNKRLEKHITDIDKKCMDVFQMVSWPGNLRQLEQVLERMILLSETSVLSAKDIPAEVLKEMNHSSHLDASKFREIVKRQTQTLEKDLIERALLEMDGNVTKTAEFLGLSRKGLQLKMKELGIK